MGRGLGLIVLAGAVLLAGCHAGTGSDTGASPTEPAALDTGNYVTTPGGPQGAAGADGPAIEARRMAGAVTGPWQVDPALTGRNPLPATVKTGPYDGGTDRWRQLLPDGLAAIAAEHGVIAGFGSFRSGPATETQLVNAVLRFPDPAAATAAAEALAAGVAAPYTPLPLDARPATAVLVDRQGDRVFTESFTPHGPFVLYQSTLTNAADATEADADADDPDGPALRLITQTLDLQAALLDGFTPTAVAGLGELAKDPSDGLLSRTLTAAGNRIPGLSAGVWQPAGWLHFEDDPAGAASLFAAAGVDWITQLLATVYQTRDPDAAAGLADGLAAAAAAQPDVVAAEPAPGPPVVRCFERTAGAAGESDPPSTQRIAWRFKCIAAVDRYVFTVFSLSENDIHQQVAAEYRLLTGD